MSPLCCQRVGTTAPRNVGYPPNDTPLSAINACAPRNGPVLELQRVYELAGVAREDIYNC